MRDSVGNSDGLKISKPIISWKKKCFVEKNQMIKVAP